MERAGLKSIITIMVVSTLCVITIGTLVFAFISGADGLFTGAFGLFGSQVGAIVTYYFTRKSPDGTEMK